MSVFISTRCFLSCRVVVFPSLFFGLKVTHCVTWLCFCLSISLWVQEQTSAASNIWLCFVSLPLVAKLCFGSSFPKHYSEKCWSELCVMGLQMPCRKDVGRQGRKGEEHHLCGNFLGICFSKINREVPEYFPLPTLVSPGRALPILPFGQKSVW